MRIDMLDHYPSASLVRQLRRFRERRIRVLSQVVDVRQTGKADSKTKELKYPLRAVNGAPVVGKGRLNHPSA
jgi:hypothetical protein